MMPEWHHLDSSSAMSEQQESVKKKTLKSSSRSFLFSTGLITDIIKIFDSLHWLLVMAIEPSNMLLFSSELIDHVVTILPTCFFIMVGIKLTAPYNVH